MGEKGHHSVNQEKLKKQQLLPRSGKDRLGGSPFALRARWQQAMAVGVVLIPEELRIEDKEG